MVYSHRKNMGTLRPVYKNNDSSEAKRIIYAFGLWKAQTRILEKGTKTLDKWEDVGGRVPKHIAARQAHFSGEEKL